MKMNRKDMKQERRSACAAILVTLGLAALSPSVGAQTFNYTNNDLLLGFRKTGTFQENYEVVVNIGKATNYLDAANGAVINVPNFSASQLTPDSFSSLNDLNWSVFGYVKTNLVNVLPGYVNNTLWLTVPRTSNNVQSVAPNRMSYSGQGTVAGYVNSIGSDAAYLSSITTAGPDNTARFIREPINDPANLSSFMGGVFDSTASTLHDSWPQNVEITTPGSFSSGSVVSDLYEIRPLTDAQGHPVLDPHTGLTNGAAYFVGFFTFNSNGAMTFTRGSGTTPLPPPPTVLRISRAGATATIYFGTTNGATYTLYYTNSTGLAQPVNTWPSSPNTLVGNGATNSITDTSSDPNRFYRVGAH
jgi:hypothetical protein